MQSSQDVDLFCKPSPDQAGQSRSTPPTRCNSPINLGHAPFGALCSDNEITTHGDFETAANSKAIHGRYGDLVQFFELVSHILVIANAMHVSVSIAPVKHFLEVVARTEVVTGSLDD